MIEGEKDQPQAERFPQLHLGILAQLGQIHGGHEVDEIHIPREQRRGARGIVRDEAVGDLLPDRLRPPIAVVAFQFDAIARLERHEAERPGADRRLAAVEVLGRQALVGLAIDDEELRQVGRQQRKHAVGVQSDRVRIDHLGAGHRLGVGGEVAGAVRHLGDALHGEHHIVGDELIAVLEFGVAQLELPGVGRDQLPGCGEARHQLGMLVRFDQPVEDLAGQRVVRRKIVVVRIDAGHRRADRDPQRLPSRRQRDIVNAAQSAIRTLRCMVFSPGRFGRGL